MYARKIVIVVFSVVLLCVVVNKLDLSKSRSSINRPRGDAFKLRKIESLTLEKKLIEQEVMKINKKVGNRFLQQYNRSEN